MRRILAAVVAAAVLVGGGFAVAAITGGGATAQETNDGPGRMHRHRPGALLYGALMRLEDEGVLEAGQAEAIEQAFREAIAARIESGEGPPEDKRAFAEEILQGLVDDGTISAEQRDAVLEALEDVGARVRMRHRGVRVLNEALERLVADGTLTEEQVEAIRAEIREVIQEHREDLTEDGPTADESVAA